jgi:hypothetical protein
VRRRRIALAAAATVAGIVLCTPGAGAYLKLGANVGDSLVNLRFSSFPVRYFVTNRDVPGVTAPQAQEAVDRAFDSWAAVPNVSIPAEFVGFTGANPSTGDGINVIGFQNRPDLQRVLGSTSFTVDTVTGAILESDIFFNSTFAWSVASGGEPNRQDFESIALHEVGHLLGLGHSMLGETELSGGGRRVLAAEAVMFPIAFSAGVVNRSLHADDIAGMSDIYGTDTFRRSVGSITGRVTKNGSGVIGAHVVAFNPATGKLIAGFSLSEDGTFTVGGLDPGPHVVRVEPLDDGDIGSFIDPSLDVDVDFRPAFHPKLVAVPRGGTARGIELRVVPK